MRDRQARNAALDRFLRWYFVGMFLLALAVLGTFAYLDATKHHDQPIAHCPRRDSIAGRPMPPDPSPPECRR